MDFLTVLLCNDHVVELDIFHYSVLNIFVDIVIQSNKFDRHSHVHHNVIPLHCFQFDYKCCKLVYPVFAIHLSTKPKLYNVTIRKGKDYLCIDNISVFGGDGYIICFGSWDEAICVLLSFQFYPVLSVRYNTKNNTLKKQFKKLVVKKT
ncbi:hypothetical protein RFI_36179 [Reticulomyxa filosa]|uniref:Uncharacterized protein n=1 Tax=Reticulomyxa filosa TaxID=46433 RepID=X6LIR9_RETFI|nr:hypothetical protein RFI_36179 [Reticulomyxa filosa]|eukprot:ETO01261.1 hypothetical protein RFI_36179 [Reticulomyxa filosa]